MNMYVLIEHRPYEGSSVSEFATLEEVVEYLPKDPVTKKQHWYDWTLYEVVQELDIEALMKEKNV